MPPCVTAARVLNEDPVDRFSIGGSANNEGLEDLFFSQWEQITQNLSFYLGNIAYIPYIHILIIAFTQAILFGSLLYNGQNYPAVYLQYSPLATTLVQPTVINLRVATLAIACTLVLDLAIEGALSVRLSRFGKSSTCRAELIIRCIFILSLLEPNIILLCIPSNPYTVVVAYATSTLQQIMLFSASMFVFSYALDKTPRQCCRSLLLSFTFAFAQLMYFFVSMTGNPTASSFMILSIISVVLSAFPPIIYFGMSISSMWTRWLKKTNESETHTTSSMDYLFVAVFVAYTLWCLIHALSAVIIQKLYLFQLTTSDLVIFDVPVILFALITTIAPSWSARLESSKTQVKILPHFAYCRDILTSSGFFKRCILIFSLLIICN